MANWQLVPGGHVFPLTQSSQALRHAASLLTIPRCLTTAVETLGELLGKMEAILLACSTAGHKDPPAPATAVSNNTNNVSPTILAAPPPPRSSRARHA